MDWAENGLFLYNNEGNLPESCQCDSENPDTCDVVDPFLYSYEIDGETMDAIYNSTNLVWTKVRCTADGIKLSA